MQETTVPQVFHQTVDRYAARTALRYKSYGLWRDISWHQYADRVKTVAMALIDLGLEVGQCVAIIGDNSPQWVVADLAVQCCGAVAVGIYATSAWPQVEYVIDHCRARFLFVENEEQLDKWLMFRERTSHLEKVIVWETKGLRQFKDPQLISFGELMELGRAAAQATSPIYDARQAAVAPDDVAVLIYTSGTTGPPKGAMLSHRNVTWMAQAVARDNPIGDHDEVLSFLPLCHIFERLFSVFAHITHAYTVNFIERPDTVTDNMKEVSPTIGYAVPRIWEKYFSAIHIRMSDATWFKRLVFYAAHGIGKRRAELKLAFKKVPWHMDLLYALAYATVFRKLKERLGFERMRIAYSGAAPISADVLRFFQSIGINLVEGYGQTEGTGVTCLSRADRVKLGTVGPPLSETELKIAADGEILVKSPGVFKGYFNNPAATAETLKAGWLITGDVGTLDEDGYLKITDRKKDIIVTSGGKNITPQYIENKLKASVYINDAVVIGDRRNYLTCLIMIDEDNVVKYAQDHKIQFSTYKDLTQSPEIYELIKKAIDQVNQTLARVETVRRFTILPKKLYEEDGEVTPTMKVKRKYVYDAFQDLIEAMYR